MAYSIRHATESDLPQILDIYASARRFMAENGNPTQWGRHYPEEATVRRDLELGQLYVCTEYSAICGVFCYFEGIEPDYLKIHEGSWLKEGPYGVVHRIVAASGTEGVGSACLKFAFSKCGNLRIDTHRNNIPMQNLLIKNGFHRCGIIYLGKDGSECIAYQKA